MTSLYAWGANSHGQLGLGFVSEQVVMPTRVDDLPDNLCESCIKSVSGGGGHTLLLTTQGKLYGTGWNASGQVGDGTQVKSVPTFQMIRGLEDQVMIDVACGWSHSVALSAQGQVWVWGSNSHLQLGLPRDEVPFSCLPICLNFSNVSSVSAGLRHTVVTTKEGHVYSWGHGQRGQLGHMDKEGHLLKQQQEPCILESLEDKVLQVACGQNSTYALTTEGTVMAWGDNKWGQLALNPKNVAFFSCPLSIPKNYFGGEKAEWLRAGWTHVAAGTADGQIYMWGRSDYGQLGSNLEEENQEQIDNQSNKGKISNSATFRYVPSRLSLNASVQELQCGSEHNLVLIKGEGKSRGGVMSWGWNEHGNCGIGNTENVKLPNVVPMPGRAIVIGTGAGHSFALVKFV